MRSVPLVALVSALAMGAAPALAGEIAVQNLDSAGVADGATYPDRLVVNQVKFPSGVVVKDTATLRIANTGSTPLQVSGLLVTGPYAVDPPVALPATVAAGASLDVRVRFTTTAADPARQDGTLTITSDDGDEPTTVVELAGLSQQNTGGSAERTLAQMLDTLGYAIQVVGPSQTLQFHGRVQAVGDEVLSPYWRRADTSKPVTVRQIAAFHGPGTSTTSWYLKDGPISSTTGKPVLRTIMRHDPDEWQTLLPHEENQDPAFRAGVRTFTPTAEPFGFKSSDSWSDPTLNPQDTTIYCDDPVTEPCGHYIRFYPLRNRSGAVVPNAYVMAMDFPLKNYDYNDNVYVISNVTPATAPPPDPDPDPEGAYLFDGDTVAMEAENADEVVARSGDTWTEAATPAGGVGTVMTAGPDNGGQWTDAGTAAATAPELRFRVQFPAAGTYRVSLRSNMPNTSGNSAHVGLNGAITANSDFLGSSTYATWVWLTSSGGGPNPATISVPSAGVHTVNVFAREDGISLDRVVISTAGSAAPTGSGPAESPRSGDEPPPPPPPGDGPYQASGGAVTMEVENADEVVDRSGTGWDPGLAPAGAVGEALTVPDLGAAWGNVATAPTTAPEIRFQVDFDQAGTYRIWVRANPKDAGGDSFHAGIGGTIPSTSDAINNTTYGSWVWARYSAGGPNPATITVPSAGVHTVSLFAREDGMSLDRVHMSIAGAAPSGDGPVESPRG